MRERKKGRERWGGARERKGGEGEGVAATGNSRADEFVDIAHGGEFDYRVEVVVLFFSIFDFGVALSSIFSLSLYRSRSFPLPIYPFILIYVLVSIPFTHLSDARYDPPLDSIQGKHSDKGKE